MKFIGTFLCTTSAITIMFAEFVTEKLMISEYMVRDRDGIIGKIIRSIVMFIFLIIFVCPMFIFMRYSRVE